MRRPLIIGSFALFIVSACSSPMHIETYSVASEAKLAYQDSQNSITQVSVSLNWKQVLEKVLSLLPRFDFALIPLMI